MVDELFGVPTRDNVFPSRADAAVSVCCSRTSTCTECLRGGHGAGRSAAQTAEGSDGPQRRQPQPQPPRRSAEQTAKQTPKPTKTPHRQQQPPPTTPNRQTTTRPKGTRSGQGQRPREAGGANATPHNSMEKSGFRPRRRSGAAKNHDPQGTEWRGNGAPGGPTPSGPATPEPPGETDKTRQTRIERPHMA